MKQFSEGHFYIKQTLANTTAVNIPFINPSGGSGFSSNTIELRVTSGSASGVQFSFDDFTTLNGELDPNTSIKFENLQKAQISVKALAGNSVIKIWAW